MRRKMFAMCSAVISFLLITASAWGGPVGPVLITGEELYAAGGDVTICFAGSDAAYDSTVSVVIEIVGGEELGPFLPNHETAVGECVYLGYFDCGTLLIARLDVENTGDSFYTGPAARNPDGVVHASLQGWLADDLIPLDGQLVGFEDLFGGGDSDYNDHQFVFANTTTDAPCPFTLGYWKNHPNDWPVYELNLGGMLYTQGDLLYLLGAPVRGDASIILAHQLIPAKLNIAHGSDPDPVADTITEADMLLATYTDPLPLGVRASSDDGAMMVGLAEILDTYNQGELTPNCRCPDEHGFASDQAPDAPEIPGGFRQLIAR